MLWSSWRLFCYFFLLVSRRPSSTLFPYTTLFRSRVEGGRILDGPAPELSKDTAGVTPVAQWAELSRRCPRSEEHTSELQSRQYLVCRLLLEKKKIERAMERPHVARQSAGRGRFGR